MQDRLEEFAQTEVLDTGKPIWEARYDIQGCADTIDYYGGLAARISGLCYIYLPHCMDINYKNDKKKNKNYLNKKTIDYFLVFYRNISWMQELVALKDMEGFVSIKKIF